MRRLLRALERSSAQARTLREREHRPWPLPGGPWVMGQTWERLLFAHWAIDPAELRRVVPEPLPVDTFDGAAWVGVTPFLVKSLRLRGTPPLPVGSSFPELNVRTYATVDGKPGIYFLSLDAGSAAAVAAARRAYRLPYFRARMEVELDGERTDYRCERVSGDGEPAAFDGDYRPTGPAGPATAAGAPERFCLYVVDGDRRVLRADIHHPPWPIQPAEADIRVNTMAAPYGLELRGEPVLHYAARQDVAIWPLRRADR